MHARTDWLERWALYTPERVALEWVPTGQTITYRQLHQQGLRVAAALTHRYGLKAGDRVGILAQNTLEHVLLLAAAQKTGWILTPINFRMAAAEVAHVFDDSQPALVLVQDQYTQVAAQAAQIAAHSPKLLALNGASEESFESLVNGDAPAWEGQGPSFEDPCMILYTSGSTGRPKGALITHRMLAFNAINTSLSIDLSGQDVSFNAAPLYHTGGWNVLTTPLLFHGGRVLLLDRFDGGQLLELCQSRGITILWGVPTMMKMMAEDPRFESADLSTVRYALVGGEPMPEGLIHTWQDKGVPIRQGFGMTEVGPNCFSLPQQDALRKIGSIGRPNFYIDVRLVDDDGQDVPSGQEGELWMRGPVVTPGYWRNPEANAKTIKDGWFATGDLLRCDKEGYFYVVGRKKDMYISGGENVYPPEVERVLASHESIVEAAVVGVPNEKWGEVGVAFVVCSGEMEAEQVREHCRGALARYKVPRHVVFVPDALPQGSSGKIDKKVLRVKALAQFA